MQKPCKTMKQQPCAPPMPQPGDVEEEMPQLVGGTGWTVKDEVFQLDDGAEWTVKDLRQPDRRFLPGDQMLWPGAIPLPMHYEYARFSGLEMWANKGPVSLRAFLCVHVLHKIKPSSADWTRFVSCAELFAVYSVCNFEGRRAFRTAVECVYARPVSSDWLPLAIPWPSNIAQGPYTNVAVFGSKNAEDLQAALSAVGRDTFNLTVFHTTRPSAEQLAGSVETSEVYIAYTKFDTTDRFVLREVAVMLTPPPYVGTVAKMDYIGPPDPMPENDPMPPPPAEPVPEKPDVPAPPGDPDPAPPYVHPLPEAPTAATPRMDGPVAVPVNQVPGNVDLPHWSPGSRPGFSPTRIGMTAGAGGPLDAELGWCYLELVTQASRPHAAAALGRNPWACEVAAYLLANEGVWTPDRVTLEYGSTVVPTAGRAFVQAHIAPSTSGVRVKDILNVLHPTCRVGMASAELQSLMTLQAETQAVDTPSVFDVKPAKPGAVMRFGVYAKLSPDSSSFSWNILGTPALALMLGIYESVRLESAEFTAILSTGVDVSLWMAATENNVTLAGTDQWLAAPLNTTVCGASTGIVRGSFTLPVNHQFGKEIRASTVGNHGPAFHFNHQGPAGSSSRISGTVTVTVSGLAVIGHVNIGPVPKGKSVMSATAETVNRLVSSLDYNARPRSPTLDDEDCYLQGGNVEDAKPVVSPSNSGVKRS